jgi:hypothetical protein
MVYPEGNRTRAAHARGLGSVLERGRSNVFTSLVSAVCKGSGLMLVLAATFFASATGASAETITDEEPVLLESGETALGVTELTADAVTTVSGSEIRCRRVHGWHGLKHPLFGYFYWKYILTIRWCWESGRSEIVRTVNPWSPTYWRDVECCLQFSGWDFKGHISLDIDGGANRSLYRVRTQGKFQQCFQFCFNTKTPWVRLTGYPGGAWGFAHGN